MPTVEEFEEIMGCLLGGRKPYLFSGFYPSMARVAKVVKILAQELDRVKQNRNGVVGVPRKCWRKKRRPCQIKVNGPLSLTSWHF